jgi:DNA-binding CsgD family transcriptional regulator
MLVGRDRERQLLADLVADAKRGGGHALVLRGEPGIGKSALLDDLAARATAVRLLRVAGVESESPLAFASLQRLLMPLLSRLRELPSSQANALETAFGLRSAADPSSDRFLTYLGALTLLTEASRSEPVLCLVDDAHWLDEASADALRFIARRLAGSSVAMVIAVRDGDVRGFEADAVPTCMLGALPAEDAGTLLEIASPTPPSMDVRDALVARTDGNPLGLIEISSLLSAAQRSGVEPLPEDLPVNDQIRRAFSRRLRPLSADARRWLLLAALDGSGRVDVVRAAGGTLGLDDRALADAERAELILIQGADCGVRHPLIRAVVIAEATDGARREAHRALAGALDRVHLPERAVWHRALAATPPDDDVAAALDEAARGFSARGGHEAASAAFEQASVFDSSRASAAQRLLAAASAAWQAGDATRTRRLAQRVRGLTSEAGVLADADRLRAFVEMNFGSARVAHGILAAAATRAEADQDVRRARQLAMIASALATFGADSGAATALDESVAAHDEGTDAMSRLLAGMRRLARGDLVQAVPFLREAIAAEAPVYSTDFLTNVGIAALQLGDDEAALYWHDKQLDAARAASSPLAIIHALTRRAIAQLVRGDWRDLEVSCAEALELASLVDGANQRAFPQALMLVPAAYRREPDIAGRAAEIEQQVRAHPMGVLEAMTRELLSWAQGIDALPASPHAALQHLSAIANPIVRRAAALDAAEAANRAGETDVLRRIADDLEAFAAATQHSWAQDSAAAVAAMLEPAAAAQARLAARAGSLSGTRALPRARVLLAYGELLRRARRRIDARSALRAALSTFDRLSAVTLRARAADELRAAGEPVRQAADHRFSGAAGSLTPQELNVARAVLQGLSNRDVASRLFLSPRTVEFHLRNIFAKLGIASRSELFQFDFSGAPDITR